MTKTRRITIAVAMLALSALLLATASFAWFAMNTESTATGLEVEAYTDSLFLEISQTGADDDYDVETEFVSGNTADLRLVTASLFKGYTFVKISTPLSASGTYVAGPTYYAEVDSGYGSGHNYVDITSTLVEASSTAGMYKDPTFTLQATNEAVSGTYYIYDNVANTFTPKTLTSESAYGLYKLSGSAEAADAKYEDGHVYYVDNAGVLSPAVGLVSGSSLAGYFTIASDETVPGTSQAAALTDYYVKNGNDYTYIGAVTAGTVLNEYLFWGRAYSSLTDDAQGSKTLDLINFNDSTVADDYFLAKTLYLRCAEGTVNATDLKIESVNVGGTTNALSNALRVLFVATTTADDHLSNKPIKAALYDNRTGLVTYLDGGDTLYDSVLGNEAEVITVNAYIFFDGTDEDAKNSVVANKFLIGQSVEIKFSIKGHDYN